MLAHCRPALIRGDIGFGNEKTMTGYEECGLKYLFKLKQSTKIKQLISDIETPGHEWNDAGNGWYRKLRIAVLRRQRPRKEKTLKLPQDKL